ncbi:SKN1-domain-containing protein [Pholiota conissans]|uniref:SKN1-domain-containing protein n=1 Tax=Pholiota conissans TaxID=109636 RepID=A0A9P5YY14_9AGAR|nr:SKN1-domain-containing protein [Pholiota conissans]
MSGRFQSNASASSLLLRDDDLPRPSGSSSRGSVQSSASVKYSLAPSPLAWGLPLDVNTKEPDDYLHTPDPIRDRKVDKGGSVLTARGIANLGCLFILTAGNRNLDSAGYPIISHFTKKSQTTQGGFNLGGTNASGQVPDFPTNFQLIDHDTPASAYSRTSYTPGSSDEYVLVFSDEFNVDGRTFYPGDDPFWEAVDLHYWGTNDLEWYDPSERMALKLLMLLLGKLIAYLFLRQLLATTQDGSLRLTIREVDPINNHNMSYMSGMVQSWNKFCFTGGIIEASVTLPGSNSVSGLWPAVWAMGNLGRAGFGASLDGLWPYTYDSCDVGTLPNQTYPGTATPPAAVQNGDPSHDGVLSFLPGQRLSACTCQGESHPGPVHKNGTYVGRAAPEIDVFEALVNGDGRGQVSLSAQWAPYNAAYEWQNATNIKMYDPVNTVLNTYVGGVYQQTTSGLSFTNPDCYELGGKCFTVYGFEYKPGFDDGYITWINDGKAAWTLYGSGMGQDTLTEIGPRQVSAEPMYLIANLGFSMNFAAIDLTKITFPATMSIDYIRVYQLKDSINIGCDPPNYPTTQYIETLIQGRLYQSKFNNMGASGAIMAEKSHEERRHMLNALITTLATLRNSGPRPHCSPNSTVFDASTLPNVIA